MEELILQAEILMSSFFFTREYLSATWVLLFNILLTNGKIQNPPDA